MQKQAEREHVLSSMPGEMSFCENKLKENMLCQTLSSMPGEMPFCKKQPEREHALSFLSSMPREMPFCKNKLKENMLYQVCLAKENMFVK